MPRRGRVDRWLHRLPAAGGGCAVVAVDVAYGELHWSLRQDPRVTVLERLNARRLATGGPPVCPGTDRRRPVVHRPREGAAGAGRAAPPRRSTWWRWSSRSSSWAATGSARAASCGPRTTAWRRWWRRPGGARAGMSVQGYCSSGLPGPGREPRELHLVHRGGAAGRRRTWSRPPRPPSPRGFDVASCAPHGTGRILRRWAHEPLDLRHHGTCNPLGDRLHPPPAERDGARASSS